MTVVAALCTNSACTLPLHRRAAIVAALLATVVCTNPCLGDEPCLGPTIVTVHGTATNIPDLTNTENLGLIGFAADPNGHIEFEISYALEVLFELPGTVVYESQGSVAVMSFDASGNLIDMRNLSPTTVAAEESDDDTHHAPIVNDYFQSGTSDVANGYYYQLGFVLYDFDHVVLPSEPEFYLNNLTAWTEAQFGITVEVDGEFGLEIGLIANVTSLSATVECQDIPQELDELIRALPDNVFRPESGHRTALLSRLADIHQLILDGNDAQAVTELENLRRRVDGCALDAEPDRDDWIIDCEAQTMVRLSIDELIAFLGG